METRAGRLHTQQLAEFAAELKYADLPETVLHQIRRAILDAVGCGLYGSRLPWCATTLETARACGGAGDIPVWGTRARLAPEGAALVNGTQVHSFELDDLHKEAIIHPGGVTLPAAIAAVRMAARPVSGEEFIAAVAAGYEVSIRVGMAIGLGLLHRGWHNNGVLGTFGGAVAAARILGVDSEGMADAIGIAATQSAGLMSAQFGSMIKRVHAGKAAQSGLYAASFAAHGLRGIRDVFDVGYGGFLSTFADEHDAAELVRGLTEEWRAASIGFKPYPACGSSHTSIDAALFLREAHEIAPETITEITVHSSTATEKHVGWPYAPDTVTTAQMNLPYSVACSFLYGAVTVDQFDPERLRDPEIIALASRVRVVGDADIDAKGRAFRHEIRMEVTLADGTRLRREVSHARGSEHVPLTDSDLKGKFRGLAAAVLAPAHAQEIERAVWELGSRDDVWTAAEGLAAREGDQDAG